MTPEQKAALIALAERVGKAAGRWYDHHLDADVYEALGYSTIRERRGRNGICWRYRGHGPLGFESHWISMRPFTYKLDAAMSLFGNDRPRIFLNIAEDDITSAIVDGTESVGNTPALALAAASLRALAAQGDE